MTTPAGEPGRVALVELYRAMLRIRRFDETVDQLYAAGKVFGTTHLYIGQEAVAVGVCSQLQPGDVITSTHRGHGHNLAKGGDPVAMFAEVLGRETGYCGGLGGSMHIADRDLGNLGANGIVGAGVPIAVGAALQFQLRGSASVALAFIGDGALNEGCVHEALNLAAIWKLPVVFVLENNQYGLSSSVKDMYAISALASRAAAYGIPGATVDGQDVTLVREAVSDMIERARGGAGPSLLEAQTYRYRGHSKNDPARYRSREELAQWRQRDPLALTRDALVRGGATEAALEAIAREVAQEIAAAAAEAEAGPWPAAGNLLGAVYADGEGHGGERRAAATGAAAAPTREMTYAQAINWALAESLASDPDVFLAGEDIGFHGGSFGVTRGLHDRFGPERVRDTPISEAAIVGMGVGAAVMGMRPVVEIQFSDFLANAMDGLVNQAAKIHFMFGGKMTVPMVVRAPIGGGVGLAAQHSQCLEAWFYHVPGLKVVAPCTPDDARGLLISAIEDANPVLFLEHKKLYAGKGEVRLTREAIPLGRAAVRREGDSATVVTYSAMTNVVLAAAEELSRERGVELEVIDLRTLYPLDMATIAASVAKTGRLAVCHEAVVRGGIGGDIAAQVCSTPLFHQLRSPILRIGALETPVPYSPQLEAFVIPGQAAVVESICGWLAGGPRGD